MEQWYSNSWSVSNIIGISNTYPSYGDQKTAWAPKKATNSKEFLEIEYSKSVYPIKMEIYETFNPGSLVKIKAKNPKGKWTILWESKPDRCLKEESRIFSPKLKKVDFKTNKFRLEIDQTGSKSWYEIDAIKLTGKKTKFEYLPSTKTFNLCQYINDSRTSDIEVELDSKKNYKLHKLLLNHLGLNIENKERIYISKLSDTAFDTILNLLYSNFSFEQIEDASFLKKYFELCQVEDIIDMSLFISKCSNIYIEESISNKLQNYLTKEYVLDLLSSIENSIREEKKIRFDQENSIKKMCLNYFQNIENKQFENEIIFKKFNKLDDDLKMELICLPDLDDEMIDLNQSNSSSFKNRIESDSLEFYLKSFYPKNDKKYSDGKLISKEGDEFLVHKLLLMADSSYFNQEFSKHKDLIVNLDSKSIQIYLEWIYCRNESLLKNEKILEIATEFNDSRLLSSIKGESFEKKKIFSSKSLSWIGYSGSNNGIEISKDGLNAKKLNSSFDRMFCEKPFLQPRSFIEIEIIKLPKGGIETFIGITKNLKQKSSKNNITLHLQSKYKNNLIGNDVIFQEGDKIGIMVNYRDKICSFYKNGKEFTF
eukprot:gene158-4404_t